MSSESSFFRELNCPNCGASAELPAFGSAIQCEYCGTRFFVDAPTAQIALPPTDTASSQFALSGEDSAKFRQWVKWLVIFIIVVTVVPMLCGLAASLCGVFGAFIPFFMR
jgi:DNA-directed RNA polymerase subunit RPC12/RpoP